MTEGRRFELIEELGSGTFGTVYLADMTSSGGFRKRVALKVLNDEWQAHVDAGRRLRDEARMLGRVRHRHIVQVDDLVELEGRWAVVMEYVPGTDLHTVGAHLAERGQVIPPSVAAEIGACIAAALDAAYNGSPDGVPLRLVHRDIKPGNVRITADGDLKVLDFGIARADFEEREAATEALKYGSKGYMAPERFLDAPDMPAGDVYSVGVTVWELLSGKTFGRCELSPDRHKAKVAQALDEVRPQVGSAGPQLLAVLERTLAYDPEVRPSARDLSEELRAASRTSGEDLLAFARRVVPQLAVREDQRTRASGVLAESPSQVTTGRPDAAFPSLTRGSSSPTAAPAIDSETFAMGTVAEALASESASSAAAEAPPQPAPARPWIALGIALASVAAAFFVFDRVAGRQPMPIPVQVATSARPDALPPALEPTVTPLPQASSTVAPAIAVPTGETPSLGPATATPKAPAPTRAEPPAATSATPAAPVTAGATLRRIQVRVDGATSVQASCGGVQASSSSVVSLRNVPAGSCAVSATVDGAPHAGALTATVEALYVCTPGPSGGLSCTPSP